MIDEFASDIEEDELPNRIVSDPLAGSRRSQMGRAAQIPRC